MSLIKKLSLGACILGLFSTQQAYAVIYYVSPTGNDLNNGTALTTPLKTINKAVSKAINVGDIIYVRTGIYNELVRISKNWITLAAYQSETPIIDGKTNLPGKDWGTLLDITGNNNTVSGFEIRNSNINGTYKGGYAVQFIGHHNKVSKVNVHHTWEQGVMIHGDYNTLEYSSVWQTARRNSTNTGQVTSGWGMGITAARNNSTAALKKGITSYAVIRGNKVMNNWGEGISCFAADHCTIEDNITYDNWTHNLYLSDATNSIVQRNIVYVSSAPAIRTRNSSSPPGFLLADEISTVPRSYNNQIINNFIYNTDLDAFSWTLIPNSGLNTVLIANNTIINGGLFTGVGGSKNITNANSEIRNNIISGSDSAIPSNKGITFSNNNWHVPIIPALGKSTSDVVGDPLLAKTGATTPGGLTANYFKVLSSSPVIARGKPLTKVTQDFFKTTRNATAPDIGGYEAP